MMIKKLALTGVVMSFLAAPTAAFAETTIWTISCDGTNKTTKIRVIADDREEARYMVEKERKNSMFCPGGTISIEKVEVEKQ